VSPEVRRRLGEAALVVGLLLIGGLILIVTGLSDGGVAVGSAIMGFGGVAAISAFFYEVGRGEDDERAAAAGRAPPPERPPLDSPRPRRRG
jgi:hypothetical protein